MTKEQRIQAFSQLGTFLSSQDPAIYAVLERAEQQNPWFTETNLRRTIDALTSILKVDQLQQWLSPYPFEQVTDKTVGVIFAGNLPAVGFHDLLAILCAGFRIQVKLASGDLVLPRFLIDQLILIEPAFEEQIAIVERLSNFDLIIATGSDNSGRYFEYYFSKYPHIIRKNRHGVAVLDGSESPDQLNKLGADIFSYFGLGCRNVAKMFVPKNYPIATFFEGIESHSAIIDHYKYNNNYDFNKSIYLINGDKHFDNGFLLLKPDAKLSSPLAALYYEEYENDVALNQRLDELEPMIQCIVAGDQFAEKQNRKNIVLFGQSQFPGLEDYADGINILEFLAKHRS